MTAPTATSLASLDTYARQQQAQNAAKVAAASLALWMQTVDTENVSGSSQEWLRQVVQFILRGRERAYQIAVAYSEAVRRIQAPNAEPFRPPRPPDPPNEQLMRSLIYTGPRDLAVRMTKTPDVIEEEAPSPEATARTQRQTQTREETKAEALRISGTKAAGAAFKHTANGGRDTIDLIVVKDPVALGYVRVTKAKPCAFCLMLASRGPVYTADAFEESNARFDGPGDHKVHDSCGCSLRPVYRRGKDNWTDQAVEADDLWREMLKANPGIGGKASINAFARLARQRGLADLSRW